MRDLYIFDLDGTLALIDHRRWILDRNDLDKWGRFYAACVNDQPNGAVVRTATWLSLHADVWIFSGRSDEVRRETVDWLAKHTAFDWRGEEHRHLLTMREAGDFTPDEALKERWYRGMLEVDRRRLVSVFDDRDTVVAMWRRLGVPCFQVAPGDF